MLPRFLILVVIATLSGAAGLGHQTVWVRAMIDMLGGTADTFSKVVGAFFIGLALGAGAASRWAAAGERRWLWIVGAEAAVVVLAMPILLLYPVAEVLYGDLAWAGVLQWVLPLALVAPPALAMGLFLPWLIHALAREAAVTPARSVLLYAVNTLGGVAAIGAVILWALPTLGLFGAAVSVMGLNVAVIALVLMVHWRRPEVLAGNGPARASSGTTGPALSGGRAVGWLAGTIAFVSGLAILSMEVLFQHQIAQVSINSLYSSGAVLAVVLLCLGLAPLLVPGLRRLLGTAERALVAGLFLAGATAVLQPWVFFAGGQGLEPLAYDALTPNAYGLALLGRALLTLGPAMLAGGLVFPLLIYRATEAAGAGAGRAVGRLLMFNGLGGWLGAEAANLALGPALGLWQSMAAIGTLYLVLALVVLWRSFAGAPAAAVAQRIATGGVAAGVVLAGGWMYAATLPHVKDARGPETDYAPEQAGSASERVLDYRVGHEGVIAVTQRGPASRRITRNALYGLGGTASRPHQERQGHLPMLLHGDAESVGIMGVATGSTLNGVSMHPGVQRIEAVEISRDTYRLARRHFNDANDNAFDDPRVHVMIEDARWVIANRQQAYDVVIGDVFLPWKTGTGRMYTREHFAAVRQALRPGGLYCQWLPMYQLTEQQFHTILRTFSEVFDHVALVQVDFYVGSPILGLVGGWDISEHDWQVTAAAADRLRQTGRTRDPLVRHGQGVQMLTLGQAPPAREDAPVNTLRNAWVELDAGRNVLGLQEPWLTGQRYVDFTRQVREASDAMIPLDWQVGDFFLELGRAHQQGDQAAMHRMMPRIRHTIPQALREDEQADWTTWPSRLQPDPERMFR